MAGSKGFSICTNFIFFSLPLSPIHETRLTVCQVLLHVHKETFPCLSLSLFLLAQGLVLPNLGAPGAVKTKMQLTLTPPCLSSAARNSHVWKWQIAGSCVMPLMTHTHLTPNFLLRFTTAAADSCSNWHQVVNVSEWNIWPEKQKASSWLSCCLFPLVIKSQAKWIKRNCYMVLQCLFWAVRTCNLTRWCAEIKATKEDAFRQICSVINCTEI